MTNRQRVGLKRSWFQERNSHYDCTSVRMKLKAIAAGARLVSTRELARRRIEPEAAQTRLGL